MLFKSRTIDNDVGERYRRVELPDGTRGTAADLDINVFSPPPGAIIYSHGDLTSQSGTDNAWFPIRHEGMQFLPGRRYWTHTAKGIERLQKSDRVAAPTSKSTRYKRRLLDFPMSPLTDIWLDTATGAFTEEKIYVVQTNTKVI